MKRFLWKSWWQIALLRFLSVAAPGFINWTIIAQDGNNVRHFLKAYRLLHTASLRCALPTPPGNIAFQTDLLHFITDVSVYFGVSVYSVTCHFENVDHVRRSNTLSYSQGYTTQCSCSTPENVSSNSVWRGVHMYCPLSLDQPYSTVKPLVSTWTEYKRSAPSLSTRHSMNGICPWRFDPTVPYKLWLTVIALLHVTPFRLFDTVPT